MNNNLKCKVISKNMEREFQVDIRKIQMLSMYMKALCPSKPLSTVTKMFHKHSFMYFKHSVAFFDNI